MGRAVAKLRLTRDCRRIDWQELADLIERAPLGARKPAKLKRVFVGSYVACFAYCGTQLVGAGRAISDGVASSAVYDVVVDPAHQGRGIGRRIMAFLLARLPRASVMLVSVPGKEGFYRTAGFRRLKTAMVRRSDWTPWEAGGYLDE